MSGSDPIPTVITHHSPLQHLLSPECWWTALCAQDNVSAALAMSKASELQPEWAPFEGHLERLLRRIKLPYADALKVSHMSYIQATLDTS